MHRQAMLVSLSLSPASTAAKNDRHWAFLEEIDAPQWADLKAEEALARAGTIGDDPWFYRSHSHHEVPLTEIIGGHIANIIDSNTSGNVITPNLERKKNRGSSKAKLAFDGAAAAKPKEIAGEDRFDESPRADYSTGCQDITFGDSPRNRIASPIHCKSPEQFVPARRFMLSATGSEDCVARSDGTGFLGISKLRVNMFESMYINEKVQSTGPDVPVPSVEQSAAPREVEERPSQPTVPWQQTFFPKLNDASRLRKSLGSALRVKIDDPSDNPSTKQTGAALPKSRLVRQSVQLESAALPAFSGSERETTSLKEDTGSLRNATDGPYGNCQSETVRSEDVNSGPGLVNKFGINSSVQAFDDIRKMRKSWGSALRVPKVSDDPVVEVLSSKPQASEVSPVLDASGLCTSVKLPETVVDLPSIMDIKAIRTGSEEKKLPSINLPSIVLAKERRAHNRSESVDLVKLEMEVSSPKVVAAGAAKKTFRRSVSFDHTPGRVTDTRTSTSSRSNLMQQKQGSRASPISRLNRPAEKVDKVSRLGKGGKENTSLNPSTKTTKPNPEPSAGSPRMGRQSVTRMSMPSLTFAAHARAAMGAQGGGSILKPNGLNSVVETSRLDSNRAAAPAASASRKSAVGLDNGIRKKTAACPATVTNLPKMVTRQSILRSSMPVFTASGAKHASKPVTETVTASKSGHRSGGKIADREADLAAMLAEHNRKFRPKPKYEPRIHSVKEIREWEARTGQMYYNLLPGEREIANQEISAAKQTWQK
ncbi:hypothetical protein KC19_3G147000 [Ceratodon purpureus]|uniref:Uncharacterized protein n=1 Tax=Ceratodon purpureus TaxID=3225 RepID=A0A8T0ILX7_CERPU|nr:hypothetical protein KC19_3G147000 [Ceratodon purpureus]